jgi:DNA-binding CsgD family transcriptional regulator
MACSYLLLLVPSQAIPASERALALARATGSAMWIGLATAALAQGHVLAGDPGAAAAVLRAEAPPAQEPRNLSARWMRWTQGLVELAQGDATEALRIAEDLIISAPGAVAGQPIPWLLKLKGDALLALDRPLEAITAFAAAVEGATQRYELPVLWQIQAALGHAYQQAQRDEHAQAVFAAARTGIATLASSVDDDELRDAFRQAALAHLPQEAAPAPRRVAQESVGGLTAREREVAALVARGLSNRGIAAVLVVSERTVESHVTNILAKLTFTSRAQIAAWVVEHRLVQGSGGR